VTLNVRVELPLFLRRTLSHPHNFRLQLLSGPPDLPEFKSETGDRCACAGTVRRNILFITGPTGTAGSGGLTYGAAINYAKIVEHTIISRRALSI